MIGYEHELGLRLRLGHAERVQSGGQLVFGQDVLFAAEFPNRLTGLEGFFRKSSRLFVADEWVETGHHREALLDGAFAGGDVGFHFFGTEIHEGVRRSGQQADAFERRLAHDRHHDVELELAAGRSAERDGLIVADHARGDLHQAFAHHRVDLAGHDGTARLPVGKLHFVETAARAAAQPADVVRHVEQRHRHHAELAVTLDQAVALSVRLEVIDGFVKREAGLLGEHLARAARELWMRVDAGADRRAADRQFEDRIDRFLGATNRQLQLPSEPADFLAQTNRRRVGEMRAADLDDLVPLLGLAVEHVVKACQRGDQLRLDRDADGDMNRGREGVVRALPHVDVVVGMDWLRGLEAVATEHLNGAV